MDLSLKREQKRKEILPSNAFIDRLEKGKRATIMYGDTFMTTSAVVDFIQVPGYTEIETANTIYVKW